MMQKNATITPDRCDGCLACVRSCASGALAFQATRRGVEITWDPGRCIFCLRCQRVCPHEAIQFGDPLAAFSRCRGVVVIAQLPPLVCRRCGAVFGGTSQTLLNATNSSKETFESGRELLCSRCRQRETFKALLASKGEEVL